MGILERFLKYHVTLKTENSALVTGINYNLEYIPIGKKVI